MVDQISAYVPGIYARSEALVQATRDLDRGRTTEQAVEEQFVRDFDEFVAVQERAGLALLSDGMLRWQDLFRSLAVSAEGLDARPLTRFLDTNTFYRALIVEGEPRLKAVLAAPELPPGRWLATLPSPFALARAAGNAVSAPSLAANVLAPQIEAWGRAGCALIVLSEPFVAREGEGAGELLGALAELPTQVPLALQLVFGDAAALLPELADGPVQAVGVDFYATPVDGIPRDFPKEIMAGVIDVRSSALEDPTEIARFVEQIRDRASAVSLSPNGDLQFVPEPIAREKVARLGRSQSTLQEVA
jgi:5-methyltetrahydropteroyltriglutamate--homocysteine methyltransferase